MWQTCSRPARIAHENGSVVAADHRGDDGVPRVVVAVGHGDRPAGKLGRKRGDGSMTLQKGTPLGPLLASRRFRRVRGGNAARPPARNRRPRVRRCGRAAAAGCRTARARGTTALGIGALSAGRGSRTLLPRTRSLRDCFFFDILVGYEMGRAGRAGRASCPGLPGARGPAAPAATAPRRPAVAPA